SNKEWKSPADEDARIAKMKDGRTHLAHKAEHAVDLDQKLEQRGVPVEGWLHFHGSGVQEKEIGATVYRLTVLTPEGGDSTDVAGAKNLGALEGRQFQKIPHASRAFKDEQQDSGCAFHGFF